MGGFPGPDMGGTAVAERDEELVDLPDEPDLEPELKEDGEDELEDGAERLEPMMVIELRFRCDTMDAKQAWMRTFDLIQSALDKNLTFVEANVVDLVESIATN